MLIWPVNEGKALGGIGAFYDLDGELPEDLANDGLEGRYADYRRRHRD
jgi:hypothetical protein